MSDELRQAMDMVNAPATTLKIDTYGRTLRFHEAGHAVLHTVLEGTSCVEIQVGGPNTVEEGFTFSWANPAPDPMVRAVAALAGPVVNAIYPQVSPIEDRILLWRGTLGDFKTVFSLNDQGDLHYKAWDIAVELVLAFRSSIDAIADELSQRSRLINVEVEAIVRKHPPKHSISNEAMNLLRGCPEGNFEKPIRFSQAVEA